ncbi:MAG: extracellular solute-binding protein [SAR324 cluster bacterium]|nr:extracellular solute-binding protein [SAR324 cluster bacterium]MBL7034344.1 extracellular solute-binding protein [SAR324 cluster bacterium]
MFNNKKIFTLIVGGLLWLPQFALAAQVNILSERQEFLLRPFLDVFEEQTGIKVNVAYLKKGSLERLKQQPGSVDALLTVDISNLTAIADAGLFQPINSTVINQNVPANYRDPNDLWTALTARARVIYYSRARVKTSELSTYEALGKSGSKQRVCTRSGYHKYNVALISSMIAEHGSATAKSWLQGLKNNRGRKPSGNDRGQVKAIFQGQCDVALGNTYYMGKMLEREDQRPWAAAVGIYFPNQADRGTHMNISGGAVTKAAKNAAEAVKLLEFLSGNLAQYMYAQVNHEYPVKAGIGYSGIVQGFGGGQDGVKKGVFKQDQRNLAEIGRHRKQAIKILDEVNFDN